MAVSYEFPRVIVAKLLRNGKQQEKRTENDSSGEKHGPIQGHAAELGYVVNTTHGNHVMPMLDTWSTQHMVIT